MGRIPIGFALAFSVAVAGGARAQEEGKNTIANEGRGEQVERERHGDEVCTATASDEDCFEFWEHHINWWSMDYKQGASQAAEHRHMPAPFGFALINFLVFAGIMYRLAARPLREFVLARHVGIKKDLDEAAAMRRAADAKLQESTAKLASVDAEMDALVAKLRHDAEAEKTRLVAAAEAEAVRIRRDAEQQIQNELGRIRRELKREVVDAALAAATKMLTDTIRPEDQRKIAERYLGSLEATPTTGATAPSTPRAS